jgi:hypothetical protein
MWGRPARLKHASQIPARIDHTDDFNCSDRAFVAVGIGVVPADAAPRPASASTDEYQAGARPCAVAISASLPWPQYDQSDARWQQVVFKPLALGLIPSLEIGFYQQTLFRQDYICLTGPHHPRIDAALSLAHDQTEGHIGIISGTGQQLLEEAVKRFGIERRVILLLPGFLGLTGVLAACDLIVTLPRRIGETLAVLGGLKAHACPFPIPRFSVKQHWHARYHHDMANRWLRGSCAGLFLRS